jgi:hypothetical protein
MAYTTLTSTTVSANSFNDITASGLTAIDADKTMRYLYPKEGKTVLIIQATSSGDTVNVTVGDFHAKGIGAVSQAMTQNSYYMLVLDSDRFKDFDGYIELEFTDGTTGFAGAFDLP